MVLRILFATMMLASCGGTEAREVVAGDVLADEFEDGELLDEDDAPDDVELLADLETSPEVAFDVMDDPEIMDIIEPDASAEVDLEDTVEPDIQADSETPEVIDVPADVVVFDQPLADARWQVGSLQVVRLVVSPRLLEVVPTWELSATLEASIDDGPWQVVADPNEEPGAHAFDWAGIARWRWVVPAASRIALRATIGALGTTPPPSWFDPDWYALLAPRVDIAVVPSGERACYTWTQVTAQAAFAPRDGAGALTFAGRMWLIGGWNPLLPDDFPLVTSNDVWSSIDGLTWTREVANGAADMWEPRHTAGYAVLAGAMFVLGGDLSQGHMQPDGWRSTDGRTWTRISDELPWGQRVLHMTVVHDGAIFVMGGQTLPQFGGPPDPIFYNDVWRSPDGVTWDRLLEHAPWSARGQVGGSAVLDGQIFLLGGGTYDTPAVPRREFHNDVWSTPDGLTWTRRSSEAPWLPRQYHDVAAWDGRVFVLEGYNEAVGNLADAWYSQDGVSWYEIRDTPWAARHASSIFVHDDALWVVTGNNLTSDVWTLTCGSP